MKTSLSRRRFLNLMGLGTASPIVLGIGDALVGRALGAVARRRIGIFFCHGESIPAYAPLGIIPHAEGSETKYMPAADETLPRLPSLIAPLEPFRSKVAIVDGLSAGDGFAIHGLEFALFSGMQNVDEHTAHGKTIDQYVADQVGGETPIGSVLFGIQGGSAGSADRLASTFAADKNKPLAHVSRPSLLYASLVGQKGASQVPGGGANDALLDAKLFDLVRQDLKRLDRGLVGEERALLDDYLAGVERFQKKQEQLRVALQSGGNCQSFPMPQDGPYEARLRAMFSMATLALQCGLTNVVGISLGVSVNGHNDLGCFSGYQPHPGSAEIYEKWMHNFYQLTMGLMADLLRGIGPLAADTTACIMAGNGKRHQSNHHGLWTRVPGIVYDGTGALRTGGRYFRAAIPSDGNRRRTADLYTSLAHAFGAPIARFNGQGSGPMPELMA